MGAELKGATSQRVTTILVHFLGEHLTWLRLMWRDEYLKSLLIDDSPPAHLPNLRVVQAKRAATRNQYTQQKAALYPSISSGFVNLSSRRNVQPLTIEANGGGVIVEMKLLLMRDAGLFHLLVARLVEGIWSNIDGRRKRMEEECRWLGMEGLVVELQRLKRGKSMVLKGGTGYI
jgi:hypothetical protein